MHLWSVERQTNEWYHCQLLHLLYKTNSFQGELSENKESFMVASSSLLETQSFWNLSYIYSLRTAGSLNMKMLRN